MLEKIRELCHERGISIYKLEKELGFGNGTIGKWTKGIPNYSRVKAVADYFEIPVSELTGEAEKAPTQEGERELPHAEYREVLAEGGMRLLMDADAKIPEEHVEEIVEFIKMKQRKYGR